MLSILIPTHNDDCTNLVTELLEQIDTVAIPVEIIIFDDASTNIQVVESHRGFKDFQNVCVVESQKNRGRLEARLQLAKIAKYEWLLFLDADVMPQSSDFLHNYIQELNQVAAVVFGGVAYGNRPLEKQQLLHWYYGKMREERPLNVRRAKPLQTLVSANIVIKKPVFLKMDNAETPAIYGRDELLMMLLLAKYNYEVLHIHNPVVHLGLEEASVFINKQLEAVKALKIISEDKRFKITDRPLLKAYRRLNFFGLRGLYKKIIHKFIPRIERHLISAKPSLKALDVYKLYHFINLSK